MTFMVSQAYSLNDVSHWVLIRPIEVEAERLRGRVLQVRRHERVNLVSLPRKPR
jgi:hypothetical protein